MEARDIIIRPLITERTSLLMEEGKYVFVVDKRANKYQIGDAIEEIFKVKVLAVNTQNYLGKKKRVGRHVGKRSDFKKAIIKVEGSIELFGGAN